jgi:transcriptional regulator with XRE-family HTH domain
MAEGIVGRAVGGLGDYLREQRIAAALSLRELAEQSGVSNPYLSMVERGVRNPSAQVLQQIAKALHISAEQLYVRAGLLSVEEEPAGSVEVAVVNDPRLDDEQKRALLALYRSFVTDDEDADQGVREQGATSETKKA